VRAFDLPITPFSALLSGFRMDLDVRRYATINDLRNYTALAAQPIGHLMLYVSGYRDPAPHRYADDLSTALAFATFWQDVSTDLDRGRIYLPIEDLRHFDVSEDDLLARRAHPGVGALIRYQVARTRALFERARPLVDQIGPALAVEVALVWLGGMRILDKIEATGARVVSKRPRLNNADKAQVVARALAWRGGSLARRVTR
jgi:phytoene/squalene synthetase